MRKLISGKCCLNIVMLSMLLLVVLPKAIYADSNILTNIINNYDPIRTIVIDPGHGGKDSGCIGSELKEKNVALEIALRLGQKLQEYNPRIKIIFTRTDDVFIPLFERTAIANRNNADLFISIHCNASKNASAKGSETFVMGLHRSKENLEIAKRENQAVLLEEDYQVNYGGYDPNSPEGHIILSMYQNHNLNNSITLAEHIENSISKTGQKVSRGVKQAGFVVLRTATMPSILVETGFLTNQKEEASLIDSEGRDKMAQSIFEGLYNYIESQKEIITKQIPDLAPKQVDKPNNKPAKEAKAFITIENQVSKNSTEKPIKRNIKYSVQIAALKSLVSEKKLGLNSKKDLYIIHENGSYKYLSGMFPDLTDAYNHRQDLLDKGHKGVFIFKFDQQKHQIVEFSD